MCGRYTLTSIDGLIEEFALIQDSVRFAPRYNIAPGEAVPIVDNRPAAQRVLTPMRWGLVPHWAQDPAIGNRLVNARSETLAEKPAFREAYQRRRGLVIADGFYEWRRQGRDKVPHYMRRRSRRFLALAAVWERWRAGSGEVLFSFAVVTTEANPLMAPIHHRMPVVVEPTDYERWLAPERLPATALRDILAPTDTDDLELFEVSPLVNSVRNDSPDCIQPGPLQGRLF